MSAKRRYYVTTWDGTKEKFTPQGGVRKGPYTLFGLRVALRKLQNMAYDISRHNGSVLVELDPELYEKELSERMAAYRREHPECFAHSSSHGDFAEGI